MRTIVWAVLLGACGNSSDGREVYPDARAVDAGPRDAAYVCSPLTVPRRAGPACLALAPGALAGTSPFGNLDVSLDYFAAGDCITHSTATIGWTGACSERVQLQFPYPVSTNGTTRSVTGSFDTDARFTFQPPGWAPRSDVTTVHVDVAQWQEGQGIHDIDITVTVTDPRYALAPWRIHGTFCDWPTWLC